MIHKTSSAICFLTLLFVGSTYVEGSTVARRRLSCGLYGIADEYLPSSHHGPSTVKRDDETSKCEYTVSACLPMPFSPKVAYHAYSDFSRHTAWSNFLKKVDCVVPPNGSSDMGVSKLTASVLGMPYASVCKGSRAEVQQFRPFPRKKYLVQFDSVSGVEMRGCIEFTEHNNDPNTTTAKLNIQFVPPKLFASVFPKPQALLRFVENRMILRDLRKFRDVVMEEEEL